MAELHFDAQKKVYAELCEKYPECPAMWKYFLALTEIPRPSHHTEKVSKWAQEVGKKIGGTVKADELGNVCIAIPATKGKENLPGIVLQAHLDMVPTKTADITHNFETDPLVPYIDGELIRATKTTLGGDDGSGVAAALAIAEDKSIEHGPLEILFTIDEETGLVGALGLKEGELLSKKAKYLVNIDSEDWGEITLSCAGGVDRILSFPMSRAAHNTAFNHYTLTLQDFKGGHSGCEIHVGRANATMWLVEMLLKNDAAINGAEYRLAKMHGGNAHNAIPSLATAEFSVAADKADAFIAGVKEVFERLKKEFAKVETNPPTLIVTPLEAATAPQALTFSSTRTALEALSGLHHGVWKWSEAVPSLVETSQSVSVTSLKEDGPMEVEVFARSSVNEALAALSNYMIAYSALYGGKQVEHSPDCPGWPAEPDSRLCKTACAVYKEMFGTEAKLVPIHAGLECGIIINKFPENKIEAISIGPDVKNPHTTMETLGLPSCVKLFNYLRKLVNELSK
jgi:aminoacyl-histidine dipeptidase